MQGCFMQFLRLIFVKKLQAPTFQLTFPFLIPMPDFASFTWSKLFSYHSSALRMEESMIVLKSLEIVYMCQSVFKSFWDRAM